MKRVTDDMGRGRTNRSEFAKGPYVNITCRVPLDVWTTIDHYAAANTGNNRSLAVERLIREAERNWTEWKALTQEEQDRRRRLADRRNSPGAD
jgi:hypothetical protein